jgi:hypothetical protein
MNQFRRFLHRVCVEMRSFANLFSISLHLFFKQCLSLIFYWVDLCGLFIELLFDLVALLFRAFSQGLTRFYEFFYKDRSSEGFKDLFSSWVLNELVYVFASFFLAIFFIHFMHWIVPIRMAFFSVAQFVTQPFIQSFLIRLGLFIFIQQQDVFRDSVTRFFWEFGFFQRYDRAIHFTKWVSFLTMVLLCCAVVLDNG